VSWIERLTAIENRFLDRMRSPAAGRVATDDATGSIGDFTGRKYVVLVTYKRDGTAVPSPLWFAVHDGKLYTHTAGWKVKRIRNNPKVRVAPSSFRGRPLGPPIDAVARIVDDAGEQAVAERAIQANYGWQRTVYYRLFGGQDHMGSYVEITPA